MFNVLKAIASTLLSRVLSLVPYILKLLIEFFSWKKQQCVNKKEEEQQKKDNEYVKKMENIVDNGDFNDIVNLRR